MKVLELFNLDGKKAIVTGGSSGLGIIIAEALCEAGADVFLVARRLDRLKSVTDFFKSKGYSAKFFKCDVSCEQEVVNTVESIVRETGTIDILVNNAGTTIGSPTPEMKTEYWERVLSVNLTGTFLFCREVAKNMIDSRRGGKIINISSVYGLIADNTPELPYFASKAGIIGLTRQLALELAPYNIKVNAIAPGFFPSEMTAPFISDLDILSSTLSKIPLRRLGMPEDLKGVIVFLASRASDYITGQVIVVDGGWTIW
ncbi:MAG: glucose 1-dehydrogenase [Thermoproteota archaeon]